MLECPLPPPGTLAADRPTHSTPPPWDPQKFSDMVGCPAPLGLYETEELPEDWDGDSDLGGDPELETRAVQGLGLK